MTSATVLAADVGRTTCRVARYEDGTRTRATATSCGWSLADAEGVQGVGSALVRCVEQLVEPAEEVAAISIGTTGAAQDRSAAHGLVDWLQRRLDGIEVLVASDVVTAHAGALAGGPGTVTVAGTGAVALAVGADGAWHLVDGSGWLLGDAGGGVQIGRAGLAAALRYHDGRPGGSRWMAEAAHRRYGPPEHLPEVVHGDAQPARLLAGFVPDVADAARAGDPVAAAVFTEAVDDLAATTVTACRALPDAGAAVAFAGGLFDLDDLVTAPLRAAVTHMLPRAEVREPVGDAIEGAHRLLVDGVGSYRQLVLHAPAIPREARRAASGVVSAAPSSTRREEA
jgi:glucosamine kinase